MNINNLTFDDIDNVFTKHNTIEDAIIDITEYNISYIDDFIKRIKELKEKDENFFIMLHCGVAYNLIELIILSEQIKKTEYKKFTSYCQILNLTCKDFEKEALKYDGISGLINHYIPCTLSKIEKYKMLNSLLCRIFEIYEEDNKNCLYQIQFKEITIEVGIILKYINRRIKKYEKEERGRK